MAFKVHKNPLLSFKPEHHHQKSEGFILWETRDDPTIRNKTSCRVQHYITVCRLTWYYSEAIKLLEAAVYSWCRSSWGVLLNSSYKQRCWNHDLSGLLLLIKHLLHEPGMLYRTHSQQQPGTVSRLPRNVGGVQHVAQETWSETCGSVRTFAPVTGSWGGELL